MGPCKFFVSVEVFCFSYADNFLKQRFCKAKPKRLMVFFEKKKPTGFNS